MPEITCPECAATLRVRDEAIGKKVRCRQCSTPFVAKADAAGSEYDDDDEFELPKRSHSTGRGNAPGRRRSGKSKNKKQSGGGLFAEKKAQVIGAFVVGGVISLLAVWGILALGGGDGNNGTADTDNSKSKKTGENLATILETPAPKENPDPGKTKAETPEKQLSPEEIALAAELAAIRNGGELALQFSGATESPVTRHVLTTLSPQVNKQSVTYKPKYVHRPASITVAQFGKEDQYVLVRTGPGVVELFDRSQWIVEKTREKIAKNPVIKKPKVEKGKVRDVKDLSINKTVVKKKAVRKQVVRPLKHKDVVADATISHDGSVVVTASGSLPVEGQEGATGRVSFWKTEDGQPVGEPIILPNRVRRVLLSPDDKFLVVSAATNPLPVPSLKSRGKVIPTDAVWIYDTKTRKQVGKTIQHAGDVDIMRFSDNGQMLLTAGATDHEVRLWNTETLSPFPKPLVHQGGLSDCVISSDGRTIVTACHDGLIYFWNATEQRLITSRDSGVKRMDDGKTELAAALLAISPDGKTLASAEPNEKQIRLWELPSGRRPVEPIDVSGELLSLSFSPDGSLLLAGTTDGVKGLAQVWSSSTGAIVGKPMKHGARLARALFSRDGRLILTFGSGVARLWKTPASPSQ